MCFYRIKQQNFEHYYLVMHGIKHTQALIQEQKKTSTTSPRVQVRKNLVKGQLISEQI